MGYKIIWVNPASGNQTSYEVADETGQPIAIDYDTTFLFGSVDYIWFAATGAPPPPPGPRAHYQRAIMDGSGNLVFGSTVRLIDHANGLASLDPDITVWAADGPTTDTLPNPFVSSTGVVDFYLTSEQRVDIGVTPPGGVEHIIRDQDVLMPGGGGGGV